MTDSTPNKFEHDSQPPDEVIPLYTKKYSGKINPIKLGYDIVMLILLSVDLLLIFMDNILMSSFAATTAGWLGLSDNLNVYQAYYHEPIEVIGGFFTLLWVIDLLARWLIAIKKRTYYRWFFFPFVHWYEALSCFPALRALRLLRAAIIIKRLHGLGIKIIPERWLKTMRFYYHVLLEELSDRVILTAIDNFRHQLHQNKQKPQLLPQKTLTQNRLELEQTIFQLLKSELNPRLQEALLSKQGEKLSHDIGLAVEEALVQTPEFRRYLKLIPIAGSMIESQITHIGRHIGQNITTAVNERIFHDDTLDELMASIARTLANLDINQPQLRLLTTQIVDEVLDSLEEQVKIQQWKHQQHLHL